MKGFLQEYGIIMVVVAVVLGMLAFGKSGFSKNIQEAILGSTNHIVDVGDNITGRAKVGSILEIDGGKYIVMAKYTDDTYKVISEDIITKMVYQRTDRTDGKHLSTYEGCDIDKYLENTWYKGLSAKMQNAIQTSNIKQAAYSIQNDLASKSETGPGGEVYNTLTRHVYLPSIDELNAFIDLNNPSEIKGLLNATSIWTRDAHASIGDYSTYVNVNNTEPFNFHIVNSEVYSGHGVRPTFIIDLSKVEYKDLGMVNFKK